MHYTGRLIEDVESGAMGAVFDQGQGSILPLSQLIRGWRDGLSHMQVRGLPNSCFARVLTLTGPRERS